MQTLAWAMSLLLAGLGLHLALWRLRLPENQLATLLKLFFLVLVGWLGLNAGLALAGARAFGLPLALAPCLMVALFFQATSWAYVVLYTTIEADSPSITILQALHAAGPKGLTEAELLHRTGMERFFDARIARMEADGMLQRTPEGFAPRGSGSALLGLVQLWRRIMGAPAELG